MKALGISALFVLLTTVSSAAPINILSHDGLTLSLSGGGTPVGVTINGTSLPMLAAQGGFSFREVLMSGPNLIKNPGFERGTGKPSNWSFTTINGNVPTWDTTVSSNGTRSVRISIPGIIDNKSGNLASDLMEAEPLQNYRFSAWVKAQGVGGINGPNIWVVEFDSNKKWLRQTNLAFSEGTYNWTQEEMTFQTTKNTSWINVYANMWNGYGTFWVDNILLTGPPNILKNPSFERGTGAPLNWSFVTLNGNTPRWDTISHSGKRSIKISIPGTKDNKSGYPKSDLIQVNPLQYYTLSAWVKTAGSGGTSMPSIRIVELDANKMWVRQTSIGFSEGTNDWMRKQISLQTHINTSWIYVYANIWNGYGTFWVDDIALSPVFGPTTYLNGTLTKSIDGTVTQRAQSDGIDFTFYYKPKDKYIVLQGEIQNLRENERALQIMYNLPINADGWGWGDYIGGSRIIKDNAHYENVYTIGNVRTQSMYPFASIDNTMRGLSIATPMDMPRVYRTGYDLYSGYYIQYDFGLSPQTFKIRRGHANFTFITYKVDEPEWGFRSAVKKYYGIYPKFFEKRVNRDGLWAVSVNFSSIRNVDDFGFMFDESGSSNVAFDNTNGIYSFVYSEPWGWWREFGNNPTQPSYSELIATLNNDSKNSVDLWKGIPLSITANAVINSAQVDNSGKYYLGKSGFWDQWNNQGYWYQNYPTNPDPDLPLPNKRLINYEYEINREFSRVRDQGKFIDYWKFDDNASWDSLSHSGKHSAKIYRINEKDINAGTWTHDRINVLPNTKYTFSAWIKSKDANGAYLPAIRAMQRNVNGVLVNQHSLFAASPDSNWTLKKTTFTTGTSTVYIDIYANIYKSNGSGWFDDVALIKEGSTQNLVKNGGFENNKLGSRTFYELDGAYLDSLSSGKKDNLWKAYKWAEIENYNKTHWKYVDLPLVFSYDTLKPTLLQLFSQYEYIDFISDDLHNKNKLVMANIFGGYDKYASMLDITGSEINDIEPDWQSSYRRTLSYQKPISNLMRRVSQVSPISHGDMEQYIKNEMFYGIFPSIYDASKGNFFFQNSTLYERDRNLFKKYIPIIREISKAGWQPIPYANVDNPNIRLERYGSLSNNNLYFTVRNNRSVPQNGVLMIDLTKLGIKTMNVNRVIAYDLLTNMTNEMNIQNGKATLNINVDPKDTLAFRVNVLY